jgi:hypothetical protein
MTIFHERLVEKDNTSEHAKKQLLFFDEEII